MKLPPLVRMGDPISWLCSSTSAENPRRATASAAESPAGPPPATTTSNELVNLSCWQVQASRGYYEWATTCAPTLPRLDTGLSARYVQPYATRLHLFLR